MSTKKIIALLLALAMCLSMAACGGKKNKDEAAEDPAAAEELEAETEAEEEVTGTEETEEGEETSEEVTEEEEEGPQSFNVILYGRALENVNIRKGAGKDFEKLDKVEAGTIVEIYEKSDKIDGYTWYRIGEDMWVADDGTWFELCDSEIYTEGYFGVNPWDFTEEMRQEWIVEQVKAEANITPSGADPTFGWVITQLDPAQNSGVNYRVCYQGDSFGIVYNVACTLSKAGDLTMVISGDNRAGYDPSVNYSWEASLATPVQQTVYEGQEAEVLEAVKAHCEWYEPWLAATFPDGITEGFGCDWVIDKEPESDSVWVGYLYVWGDTSAAEIYNFTAVLTDGAYTIEDTNGPVI